MNRFQQFKPAVFIILMFSLTLPQLYGQSNQGTITGTVVDSASSKPIEYANLVLYSSQDSSQVTGTITDDQGNFQLKQIPPGSHYLEIRFMGYHTRRISELDITPRVSSIDLGRLRIRQKVLSSEGVTVEGETPAVEYKIDRKVIDASQQQFSASGDAVDILENVPSVRVDIEGNVSLRGSGSFTVLIDGRPTALEGSEALKQIPASSIKNIEIITNPSVKYDPEGTAGIINVVLKEQKYSGSSGMVDLDAGMNRKYSGDLRYQRKGDNYQFILSGDYRRRHYDGSSRQERETTHEGNTTHISSSGNATRGHDGGGFRAAFEYQFSEQSQLNINTRYGEYLWERNSDLDYLEWTGSRENAEQYVSRELFQRDGRYYDIGATYFHQFNGEGHELKAEFEHDVHDGSGKSRNKLITPAGEVMEGRKSLESGPSRDYELELEYTFPHWETQKFEAGYELEVEDEEEENDQYIWDQSTDAYVYQQRYSTSMISTSNTQSLFALYGGEVGEFGYQAGIRGEYTFWNISHPDSGQFFSLDRWDYFPSVHMSYSFGGPQQLMASYSRRIDRPRGWYMEPFLTWQDAYTVRRGNPGLLPEYIDSYEVGFQTKIGKSVFNLETYYRNTHNKIEWIRSVWADNVTLRTVENVGQDYSLGTEFNLRYQLLKIWDLNLMGDLFHYRVTGTLDDRSFDRESYNWRTRVNNTFRLGETWKIQFSGMYQSPTVSSQGRETGYFRSNLAIRKDFFDEQLALTLQVRDLFDTAQREERTSGAGFSSYSYRDRESPVVMLNIRLNINNYEENRGRGPGDGGGPGFEG